MGPNLPGSDPSKPGITIAFGYERVNVLILGPYKSRGLGKLQKIRDGLRKKGINSCNLVIDLPNLSEYSTLSTIERNYLKSVNEIENNDKDLLVFVFFGKLDLAGVSIELTHAICKNLFSKIVVAIEDGWESKISTMISGSISHNVEKKRVIYFKSIKDIIDEVAGIVYIYDFS
jgi:hypothetical protein